MSTEEEPKYKVTIIAKSGVFARTGLDEKSPVSCTYPNGKPLWGYGIARSSEDIDHVRVSKIGALKEQWIRCWERDGSNPLVLVEKLRPEEELLINEIRNLAKVIKDKDFFPRS